jgi:hypothetical protein
MDALRAIWLGTGSLFPLPIQSALLGVFGLIYLALGWWALGRFERLALHYGLEEF